MIEDLQSLDRSLFLFLNSFHSEWLNKPMILLSGQIIWLPLLLFSLFLAYKSKSSKELYLFGLFLLLTLISSDVTSSYILKNIVTRLRPCREVDLNQLIYHFGQKCGGKFGFVSSHAANSFALVLFTVRTLPIGKYWMVLIWSLPLLVSYSRIYLGVHYPGDVLAGALVGLFWSFCFSWMLNKSKP